MTSTSARYKSPLSSKKSSNKCSACCGKNYTNFISYLMQLYWMEILLGFTLLTSALTNQDALSMLLPFFSTVWQYPFNVKTSVLWRLLKRSIEIFEFGHVLNSIKRLKQRCTKQPTLLRKPCNKNYEDIRNSGLTRTFRSFWGYDCVVRTPESA